MKGVVYTRPGKIEGLQIMDVPDLEPGPGQIIVRVVSSSINFTDYFPFQKAAHAKWLQNQWLSRLTDPGLDKVMGCDFAGNVVAIGAAVTEIEVGDRVFGITDGFHYGAWAQYVCVDENQVAFTPSNQGFRQCASLPMAAGTAVSAVDGAQVAINKRVLVVGITGGVGQFVLQYVQALGGNVTGVCPPEKCYLAEHYYVPEVIEERPGWQKQLNGQFDCIIVVNGKRAPGFIRRFLTPNGCYVEVHQHQTEIHTNPFGNMMDVGLRWYQGHLEHLFTRPDWLWKVANLAQRDILQPELDATFSINYIQDALRYTLKNSIDGKIALMLNFDDQSIDEE